MTRRSRRLLKFVVLVYACAVGAFLYAASLGRSEITRPELVPERLTIVQRNMYTGWRAEERFAAARREIVAARYRIRAAEAGLETGQLVDEVALDALVENQGTVLVWNPRYCVAFAARRAVSGEEIADASGRILVRVGDVLDEERLVSLAMALDAEKGGARHERIWIKGTGRLVVLDVTCAFVCVNFLALAVLLYAILWEPVQRLLAERSQLVREEFEHARQGREPSAPTAPAPPSPPESRSFPGA